MEEKFKRLKKDLKGAGINKEGAGADQERINIRVENVKKLGTPKKRFKMSMHVGS